MMQFSQAPIYKHRWVKGNVSPASYGSQDERSGNSKTLDTYQVSKVYLVLSAGCQSDLCAGLQNRLEGFDSPTCLYMLEKIIILGIIVLVVALIWYLKGLYQVKCPKCSGRMFFWKLEEDSNIWRCEDCGHEIVIRG